MSPRTTRTLLSCGLAPIAFLVVFLIAGATRPGYDPVHRWGSELSLGEGGWVQITNFVVTGVLLLGFAVGLRRRLHPGPGSMILSVLTAVFGLNLIIAGVFVMDPEPGYPPGSLGTVTPTLHGAIHDANALPTFLALWGLALAMTWFFARQPAKRPWMWYSLATAIIVPAAFVTAGIMSEDPPAPFGLAQRVAIVEGWSWLGLVAAQFLRQPSPSAAATPMASLNP